VAIYDAKLRKIAQRHYSFKWVVGAVTGFYPVAQGVSKPLHLRIGETHGRQSRQLGSAVAVC
jgi:hypothetical protein